MLIIFLYFLPGSLSVYLVSLLTQFYLHILVETARFVCCEGLYTSEINRSN